jgi:hypothetical protein
MVEKYQRVWQTFDRSRKLENPRVMTTELHTEAGDGLLGASDTTDFSPQKSYWQHDCIDYLLTWTVVHPSESTDQMKSNIFKIHTTLLAEWINTAMCFGQCGMSDMWYANLIYYSHVSTVIGLGPVSHSHDVTFDKSLNYKLSVPVLWYFNWNWAYYWGNWINSMENAILAKLFQNT